jgi:hypothetical protein
MARDKQGELCLEQHYSLREMRSYCVDIRIRVVGGAQKVRSGSILAIQINPDRHGPCLTKHCVISDRSEQNSSKLRHTVCDVFRSRSAI